MENYRTFPLDNLHQFINVLSIAHNNFHHWTINMLFYMISFVGETECFFFRLILATSMWKSLCLWVNFERTKCQPRIHWIEWCIRIKKNNSLLRIANNRFHIRNIQCFASKLSISTERIVYSRKLHRPMRYG